MGCNLIILLHWTFSFLSSIMCNVGNKVLNIWLEQMFEAVGWLIELVERLCLDRLLVRFVRNMYVSMEV